MGNASFTFTSATALGPVVTATAIDLNGNTSEFSQCISVGKAQSDDLSVKRVGTTDSINEDGSFSYTVTVSNDSKYPPDNLTLNEPLPANANLESVTASPGSKVNALSAGSAGTIVCTCV
ncbi:MAG: hypothetical protein ACREDR_13185 [Blastocatellia bacterium]